VDLFGRKTLAFSQIKTTGEKSEIPLEKYNKYSTYIYVTLRYVIVASYMLT